MSMIIANASGSTTSVTRRLRPLVKMKVDPKTAQESLREAHITTTLRLSAQSEMESKRDVPGRLWSSRSETRHTCSGSEFSDHLGWNPGWKVSALCR